MQITVQMREGVPVFILNGQFNALGAASFDEEAAKLPSDIHYVIIDFSDCQFLTSAGIRSLIKLEKKLLERKGRILLAHLSNTIHQVLEISGLSRQFRLFDTVGNASAWIQASEDSMKHIVSYKKSERKYLVTDLSIEGTQLHIWGLSPGRQAENFIHAALNELDLAIGTGCLSASREQANVYEGPFLSTGTFFGFIPFDRSLPYDYLIAAKPSETGVYIKSGFNFRGKPSVIFETDLDFSGRYSQMVQDVFSFMKEKLHHIPAIAGFLYYSEYDFPAEDVREIERKEKCLLSFSVAINDAGLSDLNDDALERSLGNIGFTAINEDIRFFGLTVTLSETEEIKDYSDITHSLHSFIDSDNLAAIIPLDKDTRITKGKIWVYIPDTIQNAEDARLKIETVGDFPVPDEWQIIIRNIYKDCSRVVLDPIHGGFSAKTFHVTSFDDQGRRRLPTVLKMAGIDIIDREEKNYNRYVKNYILNNSTSIMGSYKYGEWKGLCYSFVGINGPDSIITWLTHIYKSQPSVKLAPIFDRIFTDILRPWYGQPRLETIFPFRDHNPLHTFFPDIFKDAENILCIRSDKQYIHIPELGREIINPYWFLEHEFKRRENYSKLWYTCITHRDLNMQNILLDEVENIYIIDFSETQAGNAIADFARLEPILKIEMTDLKNDADLRAILEFEQGLLVPQRLNEKPELSYHGHDTAVPKAYEVICRLRQYADKVTIFEEDILPYLLAVLEWTYPVVSYKGVDLIRKRYSAVSAALICEKIMELDKNSLT
ncbi:MAG: STAS domain-containing protein [Bacteroidetes bacterium]|nr:STAS domain-containing protein [Bacteroidota bacterium]